MFKRSLIIMTVAGAMLAACGGGGNTSLAVFGGADASAGKSVGGAARAGTPVVFTPVVTDTMSGVTTPRRVVIRDEAAWRTLWAEHNLARDPAPALPQIDFSRQMLIALFSGERPDPCRSTSVLRIGADAGKLLVWYEERDISVLALCVPVVAHPMQVVATARSDAPVEFVEVRGEDVTLRTIASSNPSRIMTARQVVIKDSDAWARLWAEHDGGVTPLPAIDFSREFVIGVFRGAQTSGCHGTGIDRVIRLHDRLLVRQVDVDPGPGLICTTAIVYPARLVAVARSEAGDPDIVEFSTAVRLLQ